MSFFNRKTLYFIIFLAVVVVAIFFSVRHFDMKSNAPTQNGDKKSQIVKGQALSVGNKKVFNVKVANVKVEDLEVYQDTLGIFYNYNQGLISSETSGIVEKINADIGEIVEAGQVLATVNTTTLLNNKQRLEVKVSNLNAQVKNQEDNVARSKKLYSKGFLSKSEYDAAVLSLQNLKDQLNSANIDLQDANITLAKSSVKAQVRGVVQERKITVGDFVSTGTVLFKIVNNNNLSIVASYPENYADMFQENQKAIIKLNSKQVINSYVKQIKPVINSENRSIEILIDIKNNQYNIKPGGTAKVSILVNTKKDALMVPEEAVVLRAKGNVVYVINDNVAKEVQVEVGNHKDDFIEIISGLSSEDTIATKGAQYLDNGVMVNVNK